MKLFSLSVLEISNTGRHCTTCMPSYSKHVVISFRKSILLAHNFFGELCPSPPPLHWCCCTLSQGISYGSFMYFGNDGAYLRSDRDAYFCGIVFVCLNCHNYWQMLLLFSCMGLWCCCCCRCNLEAKNTCVYIYNRCY